MKLMNYIAKIFCVSFALLPLITTAALVPCGTSTTHPCTWCDLMQLITNVINFLIYIVIPLAAVMIVVGGIMIMTAGGSTTRLAKGKEIVTAAVVGLLIALLSWLIIDTIIKIIAVGWDSLQIGPWNKLSC